MRKVKDYIPRKDRELLAFVAQLLSALAKLLTTLKVPPEAFTPVSALYSDFETKLEVTEDENTRTKATVVAKNAARQALEVAVRQLVKEYLTNNHLMTDEYRTELGLPIHDPTPTPAPVADEAPEMEVDTSTIGQVTFRHRGAKPKGQHCLEGRWELLEAPTMDWNDLRNSEVSTGLTLTIKVSGKLRGKDLYIAFRWENTRGEKGPWSEIMHVIIP
jgi:hypothetical protein